MPPRKRAGNNSSGNTTQPAQGMTIKARVFELQNSNSKLAAFVTFTIGFGGQDLLVMKDFKIMDSQKGYFLATPSRKKPDGEYEDIVFPLSKEMRTQLQELALDVWDGKDRVLEIGKK